jgi:hypothetical protein
MGKQTFDRTKKILGIFILVFFVISMTFAVVGAAPGDNGMPSGKGGDSEKNVGKVNGKNVKDDHNQRCKWVCDHWKRIKVCDHKHRVCHDGRCRWVCDHWTWKRVCDHWRWVCHGNNH